MSCKITLQGANKGTKSDSKGYERKDVVWDPTANASWHAKGWRKYTNDPATWDLLPFPIPPERHMLQRGRGLFRALPSFLKLPHPGPQLRPIQAAKIRCYLKQSILKTSKGLAVLSQGKAFIVHVPVASFCLFYWTRNFSLTLNACHWDQDKAVKFNFASNFIRLKYIKRGRLSSRF